MEDMRYLWMPSTSVIAPMHSRQYSAGTYFNLPYGIRLELEGWFLRPSKVTRGVLDVKINGVVTEMIESPDDEGATEKAEGERPDQLDVKTQNRDRSAFARRISLGEGMKRSFLIDPAAFPEPPASGRCRTHPWPLPVPPQEAGWVQCGCWSPEDPCRRGR